MRRVKNNKESLDTWVGQQIEPGTYYIIEDVERLKWVNDSDVISDINSGDLIVADENEDILDPYIAISYLKNVQRVGISVLTVKDGSLIDTLSFNVISVHPWLKERSHSYNNGILYFEVLGISGSQIVDIRVVDTSNATVLGVKSINQDGFHFISIEKPSLNSGIEIQTKTNTLLNSVIIKGARIEFDSE